MVLCMYVSKGIITNVLNGQQIHKAGSLIVRSNNVVVNSFLILNIKGHNLVLLYFSYIVS